MIIENRYDALVLALELSITAETQEESNKALNLANHFAAMLPEKQLEQAKKQSLLNIEKEIQ